MPDDGGTDQRELRRYGVRFAPIPCNPALTPSAFRVSPYILALRSAVAETPCSSREGAKPMEAAILAWLHDVAIRAFGLSLFVLLAIDGVFALILLATRDRTIVNRWTSRVLAANLILAGTGIGVPVLAFSSRVVVQMLAPVIPRMPIYINEDDAAAARPVK